MGKFKFDESRIKVHPSGYNYVRVTPGEVRNWGGFGVCNHCNKIVENSLMNLCWALTDTYCDECFDEITSRWNTYSDEDIQYDLKMQDEMSLDWYKYHLDDDFRESIIKKNKKEEENIIACIKGIGNMTEDEFDKFIDSLDLGPEE